MKVAVTGASGFVGRHVVAALARRGVEVVASSRHRPGDLPTEIEHVALDIAEPGDAFDRLGRPDAIIHLAWGGLPNYRSLHHFEGELPLQYAFLHGLIESGAERLLVAGTCYEYGMQDGELGEDMNGFPTNPYGFAKLTLLRQLEFLRAAKPFALTWARLFYSYGDGQAPTSIYSLLHAAVARDDSKFAMSAGEQLRDYLPIETAADRIAMLAGRCGDGIVNICSGVPVSIRALVERWIAANDWTIVPDLGRYPYPDYEPLAFWGRATKLEALCGAPLGSETRTA
ncbi:NAD-dependent epimerase/dehydratase family protein [Glacieibacterium megasporae]|uniref:NAD-dependent epimerase/dehydratase family protein n=1 Tax=Glacieibacterium megasporae TaxID=2835787 RepID=UPI001C1E1FE3|nr:NAD(P)-dependent oxidoreductase [Polymorphobacter megasporae]UAJ10480.1 NAD(P)-dependent oxidoreductase [Polymorphobacter megasporae]